MPNSPNIEKRLPSPLLKDYVDFYLVLEVEMKDIPFLYSPASNRNLMVLRFDDDMTYELNDETISCKEISLTGLSDGHYVVKTSAAVMSIILTQFTPFGASSLFRTDGNSFLNTNKNLEDLIPSAKKQDLKDRLLGAKSISAKVRHVDEFLIQFLPQRYHQLKLSTIQNCLQLMHSKPEISIKDLCKTVRVSEVHLRRLFRQHIGINPKRYLQLNRFNKVFLQTIGGEEIKKDPYYDDPHLIKEFRQFTGYAPTTYPKGLISTEHIIESIPFTNSSR